MELWPAPPPLTLWIVKPSRLAPCADIAWTATGLPVIAVWLAAGSRRNVVAWNPPYTPTPWRSATGAALA